MCAVYTLCRYGHCTMYDMPSRNRKKAHIERRRFLVPSTICLFSFLLFNSVFALAFASKRPARCQHIDTCVGVGAAITNVNISEVPKGSMMCVVRSHSIHRLRQIKTGGHWKTANETRIHFVGRKQFCGETSCHFSRTKLQSNEFRRMAKMVPANKVHTSILYFAQPLSMPCFQLDEKKISRFTSIYSPKKCVSSQRAQRRFQ